MKKKLHSLKDIYQVYGITVSMQKKLITKGELSVVKIGNKNFISEDVIEDYIERNTIGVRND